MAKAHNLPPPTAMLDSRTIAVSRLMLNNFPHIKPYWIMIGTKTAQLGLNFGADDLEGTVKKKSCPWPELRHRWE
jgi:aminodeoxyfutalosine synthase